MVKIALPQVEALQVCVLLFIMGMPELWSLHVGMCTNLTRQISLQIIAKGKRNLTIYSHSKISEKCNSTVYDKNATRFLEERVFGFLYIF